jgi:uncharacterized protein (DUF433 family)
MDYSTIITIEPDKRCGKPCIRGTRMTVTDVLEYLASGMSPDEIVTEFPDLAPNDIRACLAFAADRERRLASFQHEASIGEQSSGLRGAAVVCNSADSQDKVGR